MSAILTSTPHIRKATLQDAEAIAKVHVQSWQETYRGHLSDELLNNLSLESRTTMWTDSMNNFEADKHLFVAEVRGEIVAFISGGKLRADGFKSDALDLTSLKTGSVDSKKTASSIETELYAIYCLSKFQGLNIGKLLVKHLVNAFVMSGYSKMLVWVLTSNPSKHFYMHLGAHYYTQKEIVIADVRYEEQAYVWESLQELQAIL